MSRRCRDEAILANMGGNEGFELVIGAIIESTAGGNRQGDTLGRRCQVEIRTLAHLVQGRDHVKESHDDLPALFDPVEFKNERSGRARIILLESLCFPGHAAQKRGDGQQVFIMGYKQRERAL